MIPTALDSGRWRIVAALALALVVWLLVRSDRTPFVSTWQGDVATAAGRGLSGQAVAVADAVTGFAGAPEDQNIPWGDPLGGTGRTVMTQGYGSGTHAPAEVWGAIDLAIDSNGDGQADPEGSLGAPVYATHRGVVKVTPNSWPAGNHVWVQGEGFKTGYAHLLNFAVETGQLVERGTLIGFVGSSGMSSGPHLDYQVWAGGLNVNPLDYQVFP